MKKKAKAEPDTCDDKIFSWVAGTTYAGNLSERYLDNFDKIFRQVGWVYTLVIFLLVYFSFSFQPNEMDAWYIAYLPVLFLLIGILISPPPMDSFVTYIYRRKSNEKDDGSDNKIGT